MKGYQRLRAAAEADGTWPGWRERALGELPAQPRLTGPTPVGPPAWGAPLGHSVLVDVLLSEGRSRPPGSRRSTAAAAERCG